MILVRTFGSNPCVGLRPDVNRTLLPWYQGRCKRAAVFVGVAFFGDGGFGRGADNCRVLSENAISRMTAIQISLLGVHIRHRFGAGA